MIEVKGTRTAAAAQVDPADPLGLRREPLPAGRALAVWMGGLIGLALYLKSFLWPGEAAANPEPESGRAPDTGDDNQGIPTPHAMQARPGTAEPEPSAAHSASEASEAHRPSMLSRPEAVSRFDSRFAASLPALKLPTPFLSANDVLPPFRPLRDPVPETVVPRSGGGVGSAGAGAPPTGGRPPPPLPGDRDGTADPRNRAPRNSGPVNLGEVGSGATLAIALSHLLAKTADADGDVLTVSMGGASQGQIGSVSGGWRYLADTEALGEVTLRFRVSDGTALVEQTATLTVVENLFSGCELADLLVGTQMIAKGHDFRRITLVAAVNPDTALFSSDFRAPERLFALLMQAAGRAGRDASQSASSEMWVQTFHPQHALFEALKKHDYPAFAASELAERTAADLPPISHQALLRADARTQEAAQALLNAARETLEAQLSADPATADLVMQVSVYPAVPMSMQRVADVERAQMLLESPSRMALQKMLWHLHGVLHQVRSQPEHKGVIRWLVDVDPQAI